MQDRVRLILNVVLAVTQLISNYFASAGFGGNDVGQVSDSFTTAFIPAGLTFEIVKFTAVLGGWQQARLS